MDAYQYYVADMAESVHKGRHLSKFPRKVKYTKRLKFTRQTTRIRRVIGRGRTKTKAVGKLEVEC